MSMIGDRLRELRGNSSQREMAEAVGIKWNAWARYEAGGSLPGAEILERICRVHACSADWLLGIDDGAPRRPSYESCSYPSSAPAGQLPQCARCPHRKLADKMRKMIGAG